MFALLKAEIILKIRETVPESSVMLSFQKKPLYLPKNLLLNNVSNMKRFFVFHLAIAAFLVFTACNTTDKRVNGAIYNPDGIELVYVEGIENDSMSIQGFYMGKFELTQDQWRKIMGDNPSGFQGAGNLPVENVSWNDIQAFLTRLNSATGKNYRLPTDVEWAFAARGGTAGKFCPGGCEYSGGNNLDDIAWYESNSGNCTQPVGLKAPNELGIHDMTGNVWEWCDNWFDEQQRGRVVRGGSWGSIIPRRLSIAFRTFDEPNYLSHYLGFRVVLPSR